MLRPHLAIGLLLLISGGLSAQTADPNTAGFSAERLQRISQMTG
jgi:hypothetical protein